MPCFADLWGFDGDLKRLPPELSQLFEAAISCLCTSSSLANHFLLDYAITQEYACEGLELDNHLAELLQQAEKAIGQGTSLVWPYELQLYDLRRQHPAPSPFGPRHHVLGQAFDIGRGVTTTIRDVERGELLLHPGTMLTWFEKVAVRDILEEVRYEMLVLAQARPGNPEAGSPGSRLSSKTNDPSKNGPRLPDGFAWEGAIVERLCGGQFKILDLLWDHAHQGFRDGVPLKEVYSVVQIGGDTKKRNLEQRLDRLNKKLNAAQIRFWLGFRNDFLVANLIPSNPPSNNARTCLGRKG